MDEYSTTFNDLGKRLRLFLTMNSLMETIKTITMIEKLEKIIEANVDY